MPQEIEIKLELPVRKAPELRRHPLLQGLESTRHCIRNLYLDTPDHALQTQGIALRRRYLAGKWLLTLKTEHAAHPADPFSKAQAAAGFSRRQEWEYPMPPEQLDFSAITDPQIRQVLVNNAATLGVCFRTDFIRTAWHLAVQGSQIELALDLGKISTPFPHASSIARLPSSTPSAGLHTRICEIELELIQGPEAGLHTLSQQLQHDLHLRPLLPSKAARGYALLGV